MIEYGRIVPSNNCFKTFFFKLAKCTCIDIVQPSSGLYVKAWVFSTMAIGTVKFFKANRW